MNADTNKLLPILQLSFAENANAFVKYWSGLNDYPGYATYKSAVTKSEISKKELRLLFEWKNSTDLNSKKEKSFLSHVLQHDELINELKKKFDQKKFEKTFGKMSAVWQIFLLHILQPYDCPMFDKHVYRAFRFIQKLEKKRLPSSQSERLTIFHEQYRPFFLEMCKLANGSDVFDIDNALWTFGKMIKEYPGLVKVDN
jgi:hypothetical protein